MKHIAVHPKHFHVARDYEIEIAVLQYPENEERTRIGGKYKKEDRLS